MYDQLAGGGDAKCGGGAGKGQPLRICCSWFKGQYPLFFTKGARLLYMVMVTEKLEIICRWSGV